MTGPAGGALDGAPLARFRRRKAGEIRVAALDDGDPPLLVAFEVPTGTLLAEAEAAAAMAMANIRENPAHLARYSLGEKALTDGQVAATARIATAVETAILLWKDWTYSREGDDAKAPLTPEVIAELLQDQHIRLAWTLHLDAASPLERSEGNVSGASLDTNTGGAPTTAEGASSEAAPAPMAAKAAPESSAPA